MPVSDHSKMLSKQFLLKTTNPDHPNHLDLNANPQGLKRETLTTKFADDVLPLALNGVADDL